MKDFTFYMNYGFVKVAAGVPSVKVADCDYNAQQLIKLIEEATSQGVSVLSFPELSVTGYTCGDLFAQPFLLQQAEQSIAFICQSTAHLPTVFVVGTALPLGNRTYNVAVVIGSGKILGIVPKTYLPNYAEFYEARWFASSVDAIHTVIDYAGQQQIPFGTDLLFTSGELKIGVEICEDLWVPIAPSAKLALAGANVIVNLSSSNEVVGKNDYLRQLVVQQSARLSCAYLYASAGFGESTTDLVFAGNGFIAENGSLLKETERFSFDAQLVCADIDVELLQHKRRCSSTFLLKEQGWDISVREIAFDYTYAVESAAFDRPINEMPFIASAETMRRHCEEILNIQVNGLSQRLKHTHSQTAVIGISGGLDSTLALLVCVRAFDKLGKDRKDIVGVTMPGFGTSDRTYHNAIKMMQGLGITIREISIKAACLQHFADLGIDSRVHDVTYENAQARERTQILMDISNQMNGMVIGTGDLSELALGWATYNGDQMSMYNVNGSVAKTLVQHLVRWVAENESDQTIRDLLIDVVETPISPELTPADEAGNIAQKTEDLVGPYVLHDFFLHEFLCHGYRPAKIYFLAQKAFAGEYDADVIKKWLYTFFRRFFMQQFKRSSMPDGPKVGPVSLSPRGDWRMPSDAVSAMWLKEIEAL